MFFEQPMYEATAFWFEEWLAVLSLNEWVEFDTQQIIVQSFQIIYCTSTDHGSCPDVKI